MFTLGVILTALAVLFLLTAEALAASGQLRHQAVTVAALGAMLGAGAALLMS